VSALSPLLEPGSDGHRTISLASLVTAAGVIPAIPPTLRPAVCRPAHIARRLPWSKIGELLGTSAQAAQQRYGAALEQV
jgi:hypothetical protein